MKEIWETIDTLGAGSDSAPKFEIVWVYMKGI